MTELHLTDNAKVKFKPNHKNTVGFSYGLLEDGGTCPGATTGVGGCLEVKEGRVRPTCYMAKITAIYKNVGKNLRENTEAVDAVEHEGKVALFDNTIVKFKSSCKPEHWFYRLNYSGDFKNEAWAKAWSEAIKKHPDVKFWVYTRSYWLAHILADCENLALYLSIDPVNKDKVLEAYEPLKDKKNVALAWLDYKGEHKPEGVKFINCPETSGKIKNTPDQGGCAKCKLCFTYNDKVKLRHIGFTLH
jgi:hypothetical protein